MTDQTPALLTHEEALARLREMNDVYSCPEQTHKKAEDTLMAYLRHSGDGDLADAFEDLRDTPGFWYA